MYARMRQRRYFFHAVHLPHSASTIAWLVLAGYGLWFIWAFHRQLPGWVFSLQFYRELPQALAIFVLLLFPRAALGLVAVLTIAGQALYAHLIKAALYEDFCAGHAHLISLEGGRAWQLQAVGGKRYAVWTKD